jgi:hypothetical protein
VRPEIQLPFISGHMEPLVAALGSQLWILEKSRK